MEQSGKVVMHCQDRDSRTSRTVRILAVINLVQNPNNKFLSVYFFPVPSDPSIASGWASNRPFMMTSHASTTADHLDIMFPACISKLAPSAKG